MTGAAQSVHDQLVDVAARYAAGVDRRDRALFLSAFTSDAVMIAPPTSDYGVPLELRGHDQIGDVIELIQRFPQTFHILGQGRYEYGTDAATGEVYCVAHHITPAGDQNLVMFVRYQDRYHRVDTDQWRLAHRRVHIDWSETRLSGRQKASD